MPAEKMIKLAGLFALLSGCQCLASSDYLRLCFAPHRCVLFESSGQLFFGRHGVRSPKCHSHYGGHLPQYVYDNTVLIACPVLIIQTLSVTPSPKGRIREMVVLDLVELVQYSYSENHIYVKDGGNWILVVICYDNQCV